MLLLGDNLIDNWERRVDFPIPGWPARRITDPAVKPLPKTRSSSLICVDCCSKLLFSSVCLGVVALGVLVGEKSWGFEVSI